MHIQTFSVLAGSEACNARCPFCVSRMTPSGGMTPRPVEPNWRNFEKACRLAERSGVTTVLITGKGEPTLFPKGITAFLERLEPHRFPFIELQTNGIAISEGRISEPVLKRWYDLGLTTVMISVAGIDPDRNRAIYVPHQPRYPDLAALIGRLHGFGFSVRLCLVGIRDGVDTPERLDGVMAFAREHTVEQVTWRAVTAPDPDTVQDREVFDWIRDHAVPPERDEALRGHVESVGKKVMSLVHGAAVYDYRGQNLCLSTCLTIRPDEEDIRQLIFFPDGHLRYDWQYAGAILL